MLVPFFKPPQQIKTSTFVARATPQVNLGCEKIQRYAKYLATQAQKPVLISRKTSLKAR
jgi:hypothetical protein